MGQAPIIPVIPVAVLLILSIIWFISFIVSPLIASRKGYAPYFWLFACGPVGLIVIACFPSATKAVNPEDLEALQARANTTGAILTGFSLFVALALLVPIVVLG